MSPPNSPLVPAKPAPKLGIPASDSVVKVSIINSSGYIGIPTAAMMEPHIAGFDKITLPCYSFLVEHSTGRNILFDLGIRKDFQNCTPTMLKWLEKAGAPVTVEKDVAQIIAENGLPPKDIEAIVWSHWHFDHTGDPKTFPASTAVVVGPGFKENFVGKSYPTDQDALISEDLWEGRELIEITFEGDNVGQIGRFKSYDYFGM